MNSLLRICQKSCERQSIARLPLSSPAATLSLAGIAATAIGITGGLPLLLTVSAISITGISLYTGKGTEQVLNRLPSFVGGSRNLFLLIAAVVGISLISHGQPAYALFDGAKGAASSGIGTYIGEEESTSLIDTITFAMWALAAVGGIATIAGGAMQNIMVLVGGLVLFFGMAVLIGVLEFSDKLLFSA